MALSRYDASVFVYHAAVVLSGIWVLDNFNLHGTVAMYTVALGLGLLWSVYFRFSFVGRLPINYGERMVEDEKAS